MAPTYSDIVEAELTAHNIAMCVECGIYGSHTRGRADADKRIIHFNKKMATRKTLMDFLHEVGHVFNGHGKDSNLRRWEKEQQAEDYARQSFKAYGLVVPRERAAIGRAYVQRMARWGRNIAAGRRSA